MILKPYKILKQKILLKIFGSNLFLRKWVCNHKKCSTKIFVEKFWYEPVFKEMILEAKIIFLTKHFLMKILRANRLSRKWFFNKKKKIWPKKFVKNF
jgi:hypothetical protein